MRYFVLFLNLLFIAPFANATLPDSLSYLIEKLEGKEKVDKLYELSQFYIGKNDSLARNFLLLARETAQLQKDVEGVKKGWLETGRYYLHINRPDLAMDHLLLFTQLKTGLTQKDSIELNLMLAKSIGRLGNIPKAIEYRKEYNRLVAKEGDVETQAKSLESLGYLYSQMEKFGIANLYYEEAFEKLQSTENPKLLIDFLNNKGYNYYMQRDWKRATKEYQEAVKLYEQVTQPDDELKFKYAILGGNRARVAAAQGEYKEATGLYKTAIQELYRQKENGRRDSLFYGNILLSYTRMDIRRGYIDSADHYLELVRQNFQNHPEWLMDYYRVAVAYYDQSGQIEKAYEALKMEYDTYLQINAREKEANQNVLKLMQLQGRKATEEMRLLLDAPVVHSSSWSISSNVWIGTAVGAGVLLLVLLFWKRFHLV